MTVPAIESAAPTTGLLGPAFSSATGSASEDKNTFLELLSAQLRYQDPMNPTDSAEFLSQTAQFTALEKMQDVANQTALLVSTQMAFGASSLVGRQVTYTLADGTEGSGLVSGVNFGADGPVLDVNGVEVPIFQVQSVMDSSSQGTSPTPTPAP